MPLPHERSTFENSKLDWSEARRNQSTVDLHRDLLRLRRETPSLRRSQQQRSTDASTLGENAFLIRFFGDRQEEDRLLMINLGSDLRIRSLPDPLYAPPSGHKWTPVWSSEDPRYDGAGQREIDVDEPWIFTAETALFFEPQVAARKPLPGKDVLDLYQHNLRAT